MSHVTLTPLSRSKGQRSRSPGRFGWLFKPLYIIYMDDTIIYATAESEPLPVDHEYSWSKARWLQA